MIKRMSDKPNLEDTNQVYVIGQLLAPSTDMDSDESMHDSNSLRGNRSLNRTDYRLMSMIFSLVSNMMTF